MPGLAKHRERSGVRSVVGLAVLGAVVAAVVLSFVGTGGSETRPQAHATGAPAAVAPSVIAAAEPSASPEEPDVVPSSAGPSTSPAPTRSPAKRLAGASPAVNSPSPTRAAGPAANLVAHYWVGEWGSGFTTAIEVRNTGGAAGAWVVEVTYATNVQIRPQDVWNATMTRSGNTYRFRANGGAQLAAGQKVQIGYFASGPRGGSRGSTCTVNGRACE